MLDSSTAASAPCLAEEAGGVVGHLAVHARNQNARGVVAQVIRQVPCVLENAGRPKGADG
jgi:hypothetical protein